jgi:two-component system, cell cycle sensor histidine kinase and response regulator CckA
MKKFPEIPTAWGYVLFIALLVILSAVALFTGRRLGQEITAVEIDSVPGLIDAHTIRSAYSASFTCALQAFSARSASERDAFLERIPDLDDAAGAACNDYLNTIHIDPVRDSANFQKMLAARDEFLRAKAVFIDLLRNSARENAHLVLQQELTPAYEDLLRDCDVLVTYNSHTGSSFSARMMNDILRLRWAVIAVIVGGIAAGLAVIRGLARQARVTQALRDSESKFSKAFHSNPQSMVISRRSDGLIIAANETMQRRYRMEEKDMVGKTVFELGIWKNLEDRETMLRQMDDEGRLRNYVKEQSLPKGRKATLLLSTETVLLGGEECLITAGQDVTELLNAEQALAHSVEELRIITENSAIGMALANAEGRIVRTNPAMERFVGYTADEICRMTFADLSHPDDVAEDVRMYQRMLRGEVDSYQLEKRYARKDGAAVWGHLLVSGMRNPEGKLIYGIGMIEDISERKAADVALRESEAARETLQRQLIVSQKLEALGQLAGGVAHDFNNMLAAMMLYLDLLKVESAITPAMRESLAQVSNAARRAAGLTRQLLLFSRREPVQRQLVDLNAIVDELLKMLQRLVGAHFTLAHTGDPRPVWLQADPGMLEQVVMNLVVNARDAMPQGGRIELRIEGLEVDENLARQHPHGRIGRFARLTVIDTGCGMSTDTQAHIFEPFFTTKEEGKGTGLGLSTVFGIVEQHDGWILVESAEGKGSTFTLYFPAHSGAALGPAPAAVIAPSTRGRETILIAEDNEPVRLVTAKILRQNGYQVFEAEDGREAREILDARPEEIDLLLTDVVLPGGLMGDELVAGLQPGRRRPKVILMSGYNTQLDPDRLDASGDRYLGKPFDTDRLLQAVRSALDDSGKRV